MQQAALHAAALAQPRLVLLAALLLTAAVSDWRTLRIPNLLTFGGTAAGLACALLLPPGDQGFLWALAGAGVGLAALLPLYAVRILGAGDVKLMAMVGAFVGAQSTLYALLFVTAAGGAAALAFAAARGDLGRMLGNAWAVVRWLAFATFAGQSPAIAAQSIDSAGKLPYGVCICIGTLASVAIAPPGSF
ncbi:A24 family peptidase [Ramlibacter sp.]|uniref:A24 family peptidase n=1 Tax=Ramlibacter sp. TaxID=1917967 RepID=UPI0017AF4204|nr:A24 family peptidase [Ramlibacter sp.]MBA2672157.1 prepilin peptidase [Ramlibacter sp.]